MLGTAVPQSLFLTSSLAFWAPHQYQSQVPSSLPAKLNLKMYFTGTQKIQSHRNGLKTAP